MNDIIKALIQAGGAVGALGFVWLIVRSLVPLFGKKTNGINDKERIATLQNELRTVVVDSLAREIKETRHILRDVIINELKDTRHDLRNIVSESISRAYLLGKGPEPR